MGRIPFIFVVILSRSSQYNLYDAVQWTKLYLILILAKCKGYIFDKYVRMKGEIKPEKVYLSWLKQFKINK